MRQKSYEKSYRVFLPIRQALCFEKEKYVNNKNV